MNKKKEEIIFSAKRAGVTWLHSFADRAELDLAREGAKRLGTTLSQLLYGNVPEDPEPPRRFTHEDRESATLKIQITECDEFTRKCLERQRQIGAAASKNTSSTERCAYSRRAKRVHF